MNTIREMEGRVNNLEKQFVPYKLAVIAKEKGFNSKVLGYYRNDESLRITAIDEATVGINNYYRCKAPLYGQLIDWLREEHKIHIDICFDKVAEVYFGYVFKEENNNRGYFTGQNYNKALTTSLTEAINLI